MFSRFIGYITHETHRAFQFWDHFWEAPEWLPKSQSSVRRSEESMEVVIDVKDWLCEKNNFQEFEYQDNRPRDGSQEETGSGTGVPVIRSSTGGGKK